MSFKNAKGEIQKTDTFGSIGAGASGVTKSCQNPHTSHSFELKLASNRKLPLWNPFLTEAADLYFIPFNNFIHFCQKQLRNVPQHFVRHKFGVILAFENCLSNKWQTCIIRVVFLKCFYHLRWADPIKLGISRLHTDRASPTDINQKIIISSVSQIFK